MSDDRTPGDSFPVIRSMVSVEALRLVLQSTYGLGDVRCQLIKGTMSDTYLVRAGDGSYVFRIYRHKQRTSTEIIAELDLLAHLKTAGLTVARAIPQQNG